MGSGFPLGREVQRMSLLGSSDLWGRPEWVSTERLATHLLPVPYILHHLWHRCHSIPERCRGHSWKVRQGQKEEAGRHRVQSSGEVALGEVCQGS